MRNSMPSRNIFSALLAATLFCVLPLAAQDQPQDKPKEQTQDKAQEPQPKPTFEKPQMAVPEEQAKTPEKKAPAPKKPVVAAGEGQVVEEIIARVNNEIITKSELDKSK